MVSVASVPTRRNSWDSARIVAGANLVGRRIVGPLVVLLVWHLASTLQWVDPRFVPSPLTVLHSLWIWMFGPAGAGPYSGTWFLHAGNSAYRVLIGFLAAAALSLIHI